MPILRHFMGNVGLQSCVRRLTTGAFERVNECEYAYKGNRLGLETNADPTKGMLADFQNFGYVLVRKMYNEQEVTKIRKSVEQSDELWKSRMILMDNDQDEGKTYDFSHWSSPPGNDILSLVIRNQKCAGLSEKMLRRGEIYLYSAKIIMKEQNSGAVEWHQDFGFAYINRVMKNEIVVCNMALTKSDRENGGIRLIKGSNLAGRQDHPKLHDLFQVDPEKMKLLTRRLPIVHIDMCPGDVLIMDGNTVHRSDKNLSTHRRWQFSMVYNAAKNSPDLKHYNAQYTKPLGLVPADAVEKCESLLLERKNFDDFTRMNH